MIIIISPTKLPIFSIGNPVAFAAAAAAKLNGPWTITQREPYEADDRRSVRDALTTTAALIDLCADRQTCFHCSVPRLSVTAAALRTTLCCMHHWIAIHGIAHHHHHHHQRRRSVATSTTVSDDNAKEQHNVTGQTTINRFLNVSFLRRVDVALSSFKCFPGSQRSSYL